jgi:hypothetical protein
MVPSRPVILILKEQETLRKWKEKETSKKTARLRKMLNSPERPHASSHLAFFPSEPLARPKMLSRFNYVSNRAHHLSFPAHDKQ